MSRCSTSFRAAKTLAQSWLNAIEAGLKANRPVVVDMFFRDAVRRQPVFLRPDFDGCL